LIKLKLAAAGIQVLGTGRSALLPGEGVVSVLVRSSDYRFLSAIIDELAKKQSDLRAKRTP